MSVSQSVTIPPDIGKAGSFEDMRANAEHLLWLDTPQALPELGKLDRHSPSRFALLRERGLHRVDRRRSYVRSLLRERAKARREARKRQQ